MWKFADDTTVSEVVPPTKHSTLQQAADFIRDWSQENHLQLNPIKCKKVRTCFKRTSPSHFNLPLYLSEEIERNQRRTLRVIFPDCSHCEGLAKAGLTTLYDRRSTLRKELFSDIGYAREP